MIWAAVLVGSAYALCHIFSGRGAFIHVGAMIGTVMAANVFAIIIPNQKKTVAIMLKGEKPPAHYGQTAKQRSMHNNYMTLPVLLIMISNHYPMLYTVPYNWLILSALCLASVPIREFFNQKDRGNANYGYAAAGVAGFLVVMIAASRAVAPAPVDFAGTKVSPREVRRIVRTHCSPCHSDTPLHAGIPSAPKGIMFDTMDEIKQHAAEIEQQAVKIELHAARQRNQNDARRARPPRRGTPGADRIERLGSRRCQAGHVIFTRKIETNVSTSLETIVSVYW